MLSSMGILAQPRLQGGSQCPVLRLTLGLQLCKVSKDGAEGGPLGRLVGEALADERGQLRAGGFWKLMLLLVEALFLRGAGPTEVRDLSPPFQGEKEVHSSSEVSRFTPIFEDRGKEGDWNAAMLDLSHNGLFLSRIPPIPAPSPTALPLRSQFLIPPQTSGSLHVLVAPSWLPV